MTNTAPSPRNSLLKFLIPVVLIILIAAGGLYLIKSQLAGKTAPGTATSESAPAGGADVGSVIPDFSFTKIQGGTAKLSDIKAKVVLVNFWATWCEACMVEMPTIVQLRNAYKDKGFEVLGINLDENGETVVPKTLKELGIGFPVVSDPDGKITDYFDVHAIPLTVILNANRKILYIENGERDWNDPEIHRQLDQWLNEKS